MWGNNKRKSAANFENDIVERMSGAAARTGEFKVIKK